MYRFSTIFKGVLLKISITLVKFNIFKIFKIYYYINILTYNILKTYSSITNKITNIFYI